MRVRIPFFHALLAAVIALATVVGIPEARADGPVVKLTTLEWPPYTGADLPGSGASAEVVRKAFAAMGYTLEIEVLPWNRAVATAKSGADGVMGYFPEYYAAEIEADFIFSDPIGTGPLGFVEQAGNPVTWTTLDDLKGTTIGIVDGYVNTAEFDAMVADGTLTTEAVTSDLANLRKVAFGRIPLAVVDRNVLDYIAGTDPSVDPASLQFNARLLEEKTLHVCFRRTADGERMAEVLNTGLQRIDVPAVMAAAFDAAITR